MCMHGSIHSVHLSICLSVFLYNRERMKLVCEHAIMPSGYMFACRYEDLCQDPQTVMRRVADFIGVPFKNVRSSNGIFDSCFLRNPHIMSKSAGLLTQAELDLMKTRPLPAMDKFGYRRDVSLSTDFETGI